jgi:hypothetical protein
VQEGRHREHVAPGHRSALSGPAWNAGWHWSRPDAEQPTNNEVDRLPTVASSDLVHYPRKFVTEIARQAEGDGEHQETAALAAALARYKAAEAIDGTEFRKKARLMASLWREARGLPPRAHHARRRDGTTVCRELGSRLEFGHAKRTGANFLTPAIRRQVRDRLARREDHELIQEQRLWADLLSSQPMCFNLFGELAADLELATSAARAWWPGRAEQITELRFEWSPGRLDPRYLGNRTAFDALLWGARVHRHRDQIP